MESLRSGFKAPNNRKKTTERSLEFEMTSVPKDIEEKAPYERWSSLVQRFAGEYDGELTPERL